MIFWNLTCIVSVQGGPKPRNILNDYNKHDNKRYVRAELLIYHKSMQLWIIMFEHYVIQM